MNRNRGFTLIEVMISVAILGVIMILIWSSTGQTLRSKDRVEARDMVFHQGRVALRKIADDLSMAIIAKATGRPTGDQGSIKTFLVGEDNSAQDGVRFTALSKIRYFKGGKESDQCKISYEVQPDPEEANTMNIVRREQAWFDDNTDVEGRAFVLVRGIAELNIEYYDDKKGDWTKSWDSEKAEWRNRLPRSVKIGIVFNDPEFEGETISMSTAVMVPLSANVVEL
jgi:general secretion pathway protein J